MNTINGSPLHQAMMAQLAQSNNAGQAGGPTFKEFMLQSLEQVHHMQADADRAVEAIFTGEDIGTAEVLTAVQKADLSFKMMMQIRNKLIQAYQEIMDVRI